MNALVFGRFAFLAVGATTILAGCGGSSVSGTTPVTSDVREALPYQRTFNYTGNRQSFIVPERVTAIDVYAHGGAGGGTACVGSYCYPPRDYFGRGGRVHAVIPVEPGETLYVFVGGQGTRTSGGFNGGGNPGSGGGTYGGGGASDVREHGADLNDRILVAGGGGGQGSSRDTIGGEGGGRIGENGGDTYCYSSEPCFGGGGGSGGTQNRGGSGGAGGGGSYYEHGQPGTSGTLGTGGSGGAGGCYFSRNCGCGYANGCPGAGAGGGYYGGGGGGGGEGEYASIYGGPGGGGGGGSSWAEERARNFKTWPGWKNATENGLVVLSWSAR